MFDRFHEEYTLREETPSVSPAGCHRLARVLPRETAPNEERREGCKGRRRTDTTTPPSCLRQATVSAAQGKRRLSHGFCPQWQKPQFAAHARHTVAMRIMRGSPPYTGEAIMWTAPFVMPAPMNRKLDKVLRRLWSERRYQPSVSPPRRCICRCITVCPAFSPWLMTTR